MPKSMHMHVGRQQCNYQNIKVVMNPFESDLCVAIGVDMAALWDFMNSIADLDTDVRCQ